MKFKVALIVFFSFFLVTAVYAVPMPEYTLYGIAYVNGVALTASDTDYTVALKINGTTLVSYTMGSVDAYGDKYVLKVPMDSDPTVPDAAYPGDEARIYINEIEVDESPITIGDFGETNELDIHANVVIADFTFAPTGPDEGQEVSFTDTSTPTGEIVEWEWDFENDTVIDSIEQNPTHTYLDNGTYTIALKVKHNSGIWSNVTTKTITVKNVAPVVSFTQDTLTGDEGSSISLDFKVTEQGADTVSVEFDYNYDDITFDVDASFSDVVTGPVSEWLGAEEKTWTEDGSWTIAIRVKDDDNGVSGIDTADVVVNNVPPTAIPSADVTEIDEGGTVAFTANFSDPGSDDQVPSFYWDFGDGTSSTEQNPTHQFAQDGNYTVTLTVTDSDGVEGSDSLTITVSNVNPTAVINGPYSGNEGSPVQFTGSVIDPGTADTHTFEWDFSYDGTTFDTDSTEQNPSYTYPEDGEYTAALRVTDDDGGVSDIVTTTVSIENVSPTASITAVPTPPINEGDSIDFTGNFTDPGSDDQTPSFSWDFDASDGIQEDATEQIVSHQYTEDGTYTVTLTVTDSDGATGTNTLTVVVNNVPPTAEAGNDQIIKKGDIATFEGSFTDPGSDDQSPTFSWDFGDETFGTGQIVQHQYSELGVYTVTLTVRDSDSAEGSDSLSVTVWGAPEGLSSDFGDHLISLTWHPVAGVEGYKIYYDNDTSGLPYEGTDANEGPSPIDIGNVTSFQLTGLTNDVTYYIVVTAYIVGEESDYSTEITESPLGVTSIEITASSTSLPADGLSISTITIKTKDKDGNLVAVDSGDIVLEIISGSGSISSVSGADGTYTATYTAGSSSGTVTIKTTCKGFSAIVNIVLYTPPPPNYPPSILTIGGNTPPCEFEATLGSTLTLEVVAEDPDGDPLTYSASQLPDGALFDSKTHKFSWTPTSSQYDLYVVAFEVSDKISSDVKSVIIALRPKISINPTTGSIGDIIQITGSNFPPNETVQLSFGGIRLTASTDEQGTCTKAFILDQVLEGDIIATATVSATTFSYPPIFTYQDIKGPVISSIEVHPGGPYKEGDTIRITVTQRDDFDIADSGSYKIGDKISGTLANSTTTPKVWTASYTVKEGDDVEAPVAVILTDSIGNKTVEESGTIRIDTTPPTLTSIIVEGSPLGFGKKLTVTAKGEVGNTAAFIIGGIDKEVEMIEGPDGIYTGTYTATEGDNVEGAKVTVTLTDAVGYSISDDSQIVTIDTIAEIISVNVTIVPAEIQKKDVATIGDKIVVTLVGEAGGLAKFSIEGIVEDVEMTESEISGTYIGEYVVKAAEEAKDAAITVTLTDVVGNIGKDTSQKLTIDAAAPVIKAEVAELEPIYKNGDTINIQITTEPGITVKADLSKVDTTKPEALVLTESAIDPGLFELSTTISMENEAKDGEKVITITAEDLVGNVGIDTLKVILKNISEFTLNLATGLNIISVPLDSGDKWQMSDFATLIGPNLTMIIHHGQVKAGKFDAYKPDFPKTSPANATVKGDQGYIVMMKAPAMVTFKGTAWDGRVHLSAGVNLISVPVEPPEEMKLSDLLSKIGPDATMAIWYDTENAKFVTYMSTFPEDSPSNAVIKGGVGYIIMMKKAGTVIFEGKAWENTPDTAAPTMVFQAKDLVSTPLLAVEGTVFREDTNAALNGKEVIVRNLTTNQGATDKIGSTAGSGHYIVTFADLSGNRAASIGDVLEASIADGARTFEGASIRHIVTQRDIQTGTVSLAITLSAIPEESALLANYPNPFNPETWIPYKLAKDADVTIRIYNITGQLAKTLELGHKRSGFYLSKEKSAYWDGRNEMGERVASGIYFYNLQAGSFQATKKMVIVK